MSWGIYSGGIMAHCLSLYLCTRDGADIPKRGREVISRSETLQAQLFATEGIPTFLWCCLNTYVTISCEKLSSFFWRLLSGDFDRGIPWSMTDHLILPSSYDCYFSKYICMTTIHHSTSVNFSHPKKLGNVSENIFGSTNQLRRCHVC